jgi:hypothetical protein
MRAGRKIPNLCFSQRSLWNVGGDCEGRLLQRGPYTLSMRTGSSKTTLITAKVSHAYWNPILSPNGRLHNKMLIRRLLRQIQTGGGQGQDVRIEGDEAGEHLAESVEQRRNLSALRFIALSSTSKPMRHDKRPTDHLHLSCRHTAPLSRSVIQGRRYPCQMRAQSK